MKSQGNEKILIVDDDRQIQRALRLAISARNYGVLLASDGEEALDLAASENPDLIILDLTLPRKSGIEVCKEIREWSKVPIIVLSIRDREEDKISALDLGADDYITKPFNTGELLARIRAHLRRSERTAPEMLEYEYDGLKIDLARHLATLDGNEIKLTKTEFDILSYLVKNSGRVITYNLLISKVRGPEYEGDTQMLRVHVGNLRKKIERDHNHPRLIITEPGVGYRFAPIL
jgi:two-component system KDP operon response regulator KdpE